ncbi:TadE/TadG family type IV pilus assembly protein [Nocardioides bizhenqiangii]|uniref:TadE family protein n=1 Tax=Nocardioides bizhenqiangii TaxID=3095076 RepID=A0ABZ0ZMV6_9ACTN|nr:TadE family protein [Nocardioides sp. HM61]WQQ25595.1 TadE family protein [Nocardioides sp. HM61]
MTRLRRFDERGSMAVELVILAPILMMFVMLVVAGGRYVSVEGDIQAAARDAARAASLEDSRGEAEQAAWSTYRASLDGSDCNYAFLSPDYGPDGTVSIRLTCKVPYGDLGLLGLPGHVEIDAESHVRLDPYREYEE